MTPFASLAGLVVWNRDLALPVHDDPGVLYNSFPAHTPHTGSVGLAQGLTDFFAMLSAAPDDVLAVHSLKRRLVFVRPEPGFVIHASINLAQLANTYSARGIDDHTLFASLRRTYTTFKLFHGPFSSILDNKDRNTLEQQLKSFFDPYVESWSALSNTLGFTSFADTLDAIPTSRDTLQPSSNDILPLEKHALFVLNDGLLVYEHPDKEYTPTSSDLSIIISHIMAQKPPPARQRTISSNTTTDPTNSSTSKDKDLSVQPSSSSFAEKSQQNPFKLITSVVAPTSWPKFSNPLPSSWKPSWPPFGSFADKLPDVVASSTTHQTNKDDKLPQAQVTSVQDKHQDQEDPGLLSEDDDGLEVGDHILKAASPSALTLEQQDQEPEQEPEHDSRDKFSSLRVCLGPSHDYQWTNVYWAFLDSYTVIFFADPDTDPVLNLCSSAFSILKSASSNLKQNSDSTIYPYRHFIHSYQSKTRSNSSQHLWPTPDTFISGDKKQIAETELMTLAMTAREFSISEPSILETCLRTGSSQWLLFNTRKACADPPKITKSLTNIDSYLVLPKSVGSEGSLMDVDIELRKFLSSTPSSSLNEY